jgi:hypothetical protein
MEDAINAAKLPNITLMNMAQLKLVIGAQPLPLT